MQRHLLEQLNGIPGGHGPGELATLRKVIEKTLTPYGFRLRQDNPRHHGGPAADRSGPPVDQAAGAPAQKPAPSPRRCW